MSAQLRATSAHMQAKACRPTSGAVSIPDATSISDLLARDDAAACLRHGVRFVDANGTPTGFAEADALLALLRHELEDRAAERDLARAELDRLRATRNALMANLGHELRTPVNAIVGYAELIRDGLARGQTAAERGYIDIVWEAAQQLLGTIDSILDITRIQAGIVELRESNVDVARVAQSVLRLLATSADARGITLTLEAQPQLPRLRADARMLRQVMVNLVGNAIKYTHAQTPILLRIRTDARGRMVIEVRDSGPGIEREAIDELMQPFRQLAQHVGLGAGLGLPLVKTLTEMHEGSFRLLSTPGKGTRALVIMPAARVCDRRPGTQAGFAFTRPPESLFGPDD